MPSMARVHQSLIKLISFWSILPTCSYPFIPALGVLMCTLIIGSLDPSTWIRWAIIMAGEAQLDAILKSELSCHVTQ